MIMMMGVANPLISLRYTPQIRMFESPKRQDDVQSSIVLPHPTSMTTAFIPERIGGGNIVQVAYNGVAIQRIDGYRMICTMNWANLQADDCVKIQKVIGWFAYTYAGQGYGVFLKPHRDVIFETRVVLVSSGNYEPVETYVKMGISLVFQSASLIPRFGLPTQIGNGTLAIKADFINIEGGI